MRKSAKYLYRIAAVLFLLFAAGHTLGFLTFRPKETDALAVLSGMTSVRFDFGGTTATWNQLFTGFGLFVSAYLLFSVFLAWRLSNADAAEANMARTLAWTLFAIQVVNIMLCVRYFGPVQALFATACAAALGGAAFATRAQTTTSVEPHQLPQTITG
jgi:hypothetical protein